MIMVIIMIVIMIVIVITIISMTHHDMTYYVCVYII